MYNKYYSIYQGFVKNTNDPEKRGRIRCTVPEVLDTSVSGWCEPCTPVAFDGGGDIYIPPLNEAVWVMFINGDIDRPVYLGGWWSTKSTPFGEDYSDYKNTRIINYGGCTIELKSGQINIKFSDSDDVTLSVSDGKVKINGDLTVSGNITGHVVES